MNTATLFTQLLYLLVICGLYYKYFLASFIIDVIIYLIIIKSALNIFNDIHKLKLKCKQIIINLLFILELVFLFLNLVKLMYIGYITFYNHDSFRENTLITIISLIILINIIPEMIIDCAKTQLIVLNEPDNLLIHVETES